MIVKVFFGELRLTDVSPNLKINISDGEWLYKLPLALLSIGCLFPLFSANPVLYRQSWLFNGLSGNAMPGHETFFIALLPAVVTVLSLVVMYWAFDTYTNPQQRLLSRRGFLYQASFNEWYVDRIYARVIISPVIALSALVFWTDRTVIDGLIHLLTKLYVNLAKLSAWTDRYIIDGFLNLITSIVTGIGNLARSLQGGKVQYYLFSMLVIILALFILKTVF